MFMAVPRVWEKIEDKVRKVLEAKPMIMNWVTKIGTSATDAELKGNSKGIQFWFAKKIVLNKILKELGLDNSIMNMYGAAPLPQKTRDFFFSLNIFLNGVFGMSETSGPITATSTNSLSDYN